MEQMKMMNRCLAVLLCVCLAFVLTACGGGQDVENRTSTDETVSGKTTDAEPDTQEINTDSEDTKESSETETAASTEQSPETAAETSELTENTGKSYVGDEVVITEPEDNGEPVDGSSADQREPTEPQNGDADTSGIVLPDIEI